MKYDTTTPHPTIIKAEDVPIGGATEAAYALLIHASERRRQSRGKLRGSKTFLLHARLLEKYCFHESIYDKSRSP